VVIISLWKDALSSGSGDISRNPDCNAIPGISSGKKPNNFNFPVENFKDTSQNVIELTKKELSLLFNVHCTLSDNFTGSVINQMNVCVSSR